MQHAELMRRIEHEIELCGSLRRCALALGISPQYISAVLSGKRTVGPKILRALRLNRTITKTITYEASRGKS